MNLPLRSRPSERIDRPHRPVSAMLLAAAPVVLSFVLACATPFAAIGAFAAARMRRRDALAVVAIAWLANQAIGFGLLHYPRTGSALGWGLAIGVAAVAACLAADEIPRRLNGRLGLPLAFGAAFAIYEGVLLAATAVLPSGADAFAPAIVLRILAINGACLLGLVALHRLAAFVPAWPLRAAPRSA